MTSVRQKQSGFTLLELLVVLGIICHACRDCWPSSDETFG